jgi:citrate lyase beta subunit
MLETYFFIPADKPKFINKIKELKPDYFVIDIEESVSIKNKNVAIDNIDVIDIPENCFIRIPILDESIDDYQIRYIVKKFGGRVVFPKIRTSADIKKILFYTDSKHPLSLILLVENPQCLYNLDEIIHKYTNIIHGIGFGSHDFCSEMGLKHEKEYLNFYRNNIILIAKAFGLRYIDGVDLNVNDLTNFKDECLNAFNSGADGKFLIHPNQLGALKEVPFLTEEEIEEMNDVYKIASIIDEDEIDILEHNGKYYEKPHLTRISNIINRLSRINSL